MSKRFEVRIITNSTMSGYKNGREGDKVMHSFEHGAKFVFQMTSLKCTDITRDEHVFTLRCIES